MKKLMLVLAVMLALCTFAAAEISLPVVGITSLPHHIGELIDVPEPPVMPQVSVAWSSVTNSLIIRVSDNPYWTTESSCTVSVGGDTNRLALYDAAIGGWVMQMDGNVNVQDVELIFNDHPIRIPQPNCMFWSGIDGLHDTYCHVLTDAGALLYRMNDAGDMVMEAFTARVSNSQGDSCVELSLDPSGRVKDEYMVWVYEGLFAQYYIADRAGVVSYSYDSDVGERFRWHRGTGWTDRSGKAVQQPVGAPDPARIVPQLDELNWLSADDLPEMPLHISDMTGAAPIVPEAPMVAIRYDAADNALVVQTANYTDMWKRVDIIWGDELRQCTRDARGNCWRLNLTDEPALSPYAFTSVVLFMEQSVSPYSSYWKIDCNDSSGTLYVPRGDVVQRFSARGLPYLYLTGWLQTIGGRLVDFVTLPDGTVSSYSYKLAEGITYTGYADGSVRITGSTADSVIRDEYTPDDLHSIRDEYAAADDVPYALRALFGVSRSSNQPDETPVPTATKRVTPTPRITATPAPTPTATPRVTPTPRMTTTPMPTAEPTLAPTAMPTSVMEMLTRGYTGHPELMNVRLTRVPTRINEVIPRDELPEVPKLGIMYEPETGLLTISMQNNRLFTVNTRCSVIVNEAAPCSGKAAVSADGLVWKALIPSGLDLERSNVEFALTQGVPHNPDSAQLTFNLKSGKVTMDAYYTTDTSDIRFHAGQPGLGTFVTMNVDYGGKVYETEFEFDEDGQCGLYYIVHLSGNPRVDAYFDADGLLLLHYVKGDVELNWHRDQGWFYPDNDQKADQPADAPDPLTLRPFLKFR